MTKKDLQLIAQTIEGLSRGYAGGQALYLDRAVVQAVAERFADVLGGTNPRFKRDLFIQAATGVVPVTARRLGAED